MCLTHSLVAWGKDLTSHKHPLRRTTGVWAYVRVCDECPPYRDSLIEQLMREIVELKEKVSLLEGQRSADTELLRGVRERCAQLEAELKDYKEIAEQTCNVSTHRVMQCRGHAV